MSQHQCSKRLYFETFRNNEDLKHRAATITVKRRNSISANQSWPHSLAIVELYWLENCHKRLREARQDKVACGCPPSQKAETLIIQLRFAETKAIEGQNRDPVNRLLEFTTIFR